MPSRGFTQPALLLMNPLKEKITRGKSGWKKIPQKHTQAEFNQVEANSFQSVQRHEPWLTTREQMTSIKSNRWLASACCTYSRRPGSLWNVKELRSQQTRRCSSNGFRKGCYWAEQSIYHSHQKVIFQQTALTVNRSTSLWAAQSSCPQEVITISSVAQWE